MTFGFTCDNVYLFSFSCLSFDDVVGGYHLDGFDVSLYFFLISSNLWEIESWLLLFLKGSTWRGYLDKSSAPLGTTKGWDFLSASGD